MFPVVSDCVFWNEEMLFSMKQNSEVKSPLLVTDNNPMPLPPTGVTFSFFWKTQGEPSRPTPSAYMGQVISDGFKVCSRGGKGSVELYTRDNSMTWEATFSPPGEGAEDPWHGAPSLKGLHGKTSCRGRAPWGRGAGGQGRAGAGVLCPHRWVWRGQCSSVWRLPIHRGSGRASRLRA